MEIKRLRVLTTKISETINNIKPAFVKNSNI